jgi:hypothetical protein
MRKTVEKTIDGCRYRCTQFGTLTAQELLLRALPAISLAFSKTLDVATVRQLLTMVTKDDLTWAIAQATAATQVLVVDEAGAPDPKTGRKRANWFPLEGQYDEQFAGKMLSAWPEWVAWVLEVNFGDHFLGKSPQAAPAGATASYESSSPPGATGGIGDSSPAPA